MRWLLLALAVFGAVGVTPISYQQFAGVKACPVLGPVPACYVVLLGYALLAISALVDAKIRNVLFAAGWFPLFALSMTGTSLELFGHSTCPTTKNGTPTCFISLAIVGLLAVIFFFERKRRPGRTRKQV